MDIGVKYSEKQERNFDDATMKAGQCVIGLQVGITPDSAKGQPVGHDPCGPERAKSPSPRSRIRYLHYDS